MLKNKTCNQNGYLIRAEDSKNLKALTAFEAFEILEEKFWDLKNKVSVNEENSDFTKINLFSMQDFLNSETIFKGDVNDGFSDRDAWETFDSLEGWYSNLLSSKKEFFHANEREIFQDDWRSFVDKVELYTEEEREDTAKFLKEMEAEEKFLEKYQGQWIPSR